MAWPPPFPSAVDTGNCIDAHTDLYPPINALHADLWPIIVLDTRLSACNIGIMVYELYCFNKNYSSWSMRPWIALKVAGIPFNEHMYYLDDPDVAKHASISPSRYGHPRGMSS